MKTPLRANLIPCSSARNHDFDFARRHLLDAPYAAGEIRTDVTQTYQGCPADRSGRPACELHLAGAGD